MLIFRPGLNKLITASYCFEAIEIQNNVVLFDENDACQGVIIINLTKEKKHTK